MSRSNVKTSIISFPAGGTYENILRTEVHAHPVKTGFPAEPPKYVVFRKTGGVMEYLFRVVKTVDLDPEHTSLLVALPSLSSKEKQRIRVYIATRTSDFRFKWRKEYPYRFYILEKVCELAPPVIRTPNLQGYYYCTEGELGIKLY